VRLINAMSDRFVDIADDLVCRGLAKYQEGPLINDLHSFLACTVKLMYVQWPMVSRTQASSVIGHT